MKILSKSILPVALCLLLVSVILLSSCTGGTEGNYITRDEDVDDFKPAHDTRDESELADRYDEYVENASLAFKDYSATDADAFEYEAHDGGVRITSYVGEEKIVVIPDSVDGESIVSIASSAFAGKGVRAVSIPDTVKEIEQGAFAGCENISTLRLPLTYTEGSEFFSYIFGAKEHGESAVKVSPSLDMIIITEGAREVPEYFFAGCKGVSAIILPSSIESIGGFAFDGCSDLVYADLGGATSLGEYAFLECESLLEIDLSGVSEIGKGALYGCSSINAVTLSTLTEQGFIGYIFGASSADYNFEFVPASLRTVTLTGDVVEIGARAFASCKYITSIVFAEGVEKIGVRAFYACRSLKKIELPASLISVGDDAFFGCDNLISVSLGSALESIGMQAFYGCESLEAMSMPAKVTNIAPSTFYGCSSLAKIELNNVKKVGKNAFFGCESLAPVALDGIEVAEGNGSLSAN